MERWAANTLRGLGILVTAVLMIFACLLLLLLSLCARESPNQGQSVGFLVGAVLVLALGIFVIARLTRGLINNTGIPSSQAEPLQPGAPLHVSPASAEALDHLSYAIGAAIGLGVLFLGLSFYRILILRSGTQPGAFGYQQSWLIVVLVTIVLEYLPYVFVLFRLQRNPDRPALAFAMAIPAASILHMATSLPLMWRAFAYPQYLAQTLLPFVAGLVVEIVIITLAWRANQRLGYRQEPVSLIVAAGAVYTYFIIFGSANTWMYRLISLRGH